jgi:uncharacterized protein involved in exopolysaccharide biosynthesis
MRDDTLIRRSEEPASHTARELAVILFRQRRMFLAVAGLTMVLALLYAFAGAKYRSHFSVLVRKERADPPVTAQPNAPPDFSRVEVTEEELNSEAELLKDEDVLRRVADANDLAAQDWLRWLRPHEPQAARVERAAKKLGHQLDVEAVKKTNLVAVTYDASDPELAARVLRSLADAYLDKHMEVHRPGGQLRFFDQQTAESGRQLDEAENKLLDFMRTHDVVQASQQRDMVLQRLDETEASYRQTEIDMAETDHQVRELLTQLAEFPPRSTTTMRTADNPDLLRSLKAALLDLQLKKTQLLTKFEPNHRLVQEVEQQLQLTQATIANEMSAPVRDETTNKDDNYEWAKAELQKAHVQMNGLHAREAKISSDLLQYRAMAKQLGEDAIVQEDLISREKAAEDNYLLYVKKREEARMGDALDEGGIVNVAIAEPPIVPALPVWPPAGVIFVGFVGALVMGTGAALTADHLDPALRTPEEALACLEIPVLASIPDLTDRRLSA